MADFGLYMGLQRKSNIFETKAQNRQMEIGLMEQMDQRAQQKLQQQAESNAKVNEFYDIINQLDVLEADQERVQAAEQDARLSVIQGIQSFGGDVGKFMLGGGVGILADYRNNILQSDEVKGAIYNKTNHAQWLDAQAKGLWVKPVGVDVPVTLPDGTTTTEHRTVSMDEAYKLLENKVIDRLPWDGAEQDIDIGPDFFQTLYKDPRNIYSMDTEVAPEDLYNALRSDGASHDQAIQKMQSYETYVGQGGTPWRYKSGDFLKKKMMDLQMQTERMKQKRMSGGGGSGKNMYMDFMSRISTLPKGKGTPLVPKEAEMWADQTYLGLQYDKETNSYRPTKGVKAYDLYTGNNTDPKEYKLNSFDSASIEEYTVDPRTGAPMLKLRVSYRDDGRVSDDDRPAGERFLGGEWWNDGVHVNNWERTEANTFWSGTDGGEKWEGSVYVPLQDWINPYTATYFNKNIGVQTNVLGDVPELALQTNEEWFMRDMQMMDEAINEIMTRVGVSYNEAAELMYSGNANALWKDYGVGFEGTQAQPGR